MHDGKKFTYSNKDGLSPNKVSPLTVLPLCDMGKGSEEKTQNSG